MISKPFYLENLSAFDILIQDDREKAEEVIFRVFSILQRDKIWLRDVATEEEIFEEDAELLEEVEEELKELDEKYDFRFDDFYQRVQQEMKKIQSASAATVKEEEWSGEEEDLEDDDSEFEEDDDLDDDGFMEVDDDDIDDDGETDELSHISDEELDLITDTILESAKTRFDYPAFLNSFPQADELFVEEQIIFPVIAGKAHEETDGEIAEKIQLALKNSGFASDKEEIIKMIQDKGTALGLEILAFGIAADSLQQGADPTEVLHQISQLLGV